MASTDIPYCTKTWNITEGCSKLRVGCANCWGIDTVYRLNQAAAGRGDTFAWERYSSLLKWEKNKPLDWSGKVVFCPDRINQPDKFPAGSRVFVSSRSDLFHDKISDFEIGRVMAKIKEHPEHTYLFFTKRYERMANVMSRLEPDDYRHCFWITSASTQKEVDEAWINIKQTNDEFFLGLSLEPLIEKVSLENVVVDWVIVGCEARGKKSLRPLDYKWALKINQWCRGRFSIYNKQYAVPGKNGKLYVEKHDVSKFPKGLQRRDIP